MTKQISYILRQSNESLPSQSTVDITHNHHRKICPVIKNFAAASQTGASHQQEQINKIHQVRQSETVQLYRSTLDLTYKSETQHYQYSQRTQNSHTFSQAKATILLTSDVIIVYLMVSGLHTLG